jgi:hypothetical protein
MDLEVDSSTLEGVGLSLNKFRERDFLQNTTSLIMNTHSTTGLARKLLLSAIGAVAFGVAASAQTVTLRPIDTGRDIVTFDLSGMNGGSFGDAPRFAVKTNLLYAGATLTPNLAFEFALGSRTSVEIAGGFNDWPLLWDSSATGPEWDINNNYKAQLRHIFGKAGFRYWFGERFRGHFAGANLFYGDYHVGDLRVPLLFDREYDYRGDVVGASLSWGFLWRWSPLVAMEFNIDGGVAVFNYKKSFIEGNTEGYELANTIPFRKTYLGPTGAGIKLVFTIK